VECTRCQATNPAGARFCLNCGAPLSAPRPIVGERRFVTVMFADVVGSTAMGERLDPEQVTEIMHEAIAIFNAAVARYGGTVSQLVGDGILALFGAPVAHEDDPERAVRAGLEILRATDSYGRRVKQTYSVDFHVRIGINSGLAVLGFMGDQVRTEYTAMGDTTNVASRMQSTAEPDSVLISADTHQYVKNLFEFRQRGPVQVKGKAAPIEVYEVLAPMAVPGKTRGLEGLASPLVGRDAEMLALRQRLESACSENGAFIAVIGEAGLGKSRLVEELRKWALADSGLSIDWLEARAVSYGQTTTYYLWQQLLRHTIGARNEDSPAEVREKLRLACERLECDPTGMETGHRPYLEAILVIESDATAKDLAGVEGIDLIDGIDRAVHAYLRGISRSKPTVLFFDDLHWADAPSLELLSRSIDLIKESPLLFLCLLRPDRDAPSWSTIESAASQLGPKFSRVTLAPLSSEHSQQLLGNLLQVEDLPEQVRALILNRSDGNPFYLEEVIRSLVSSGHIVHERGFWRAKPEIANVTIPETLTGLLSARIDQLAADTKRVLQAASVIGRTFPYSVLQAIRAPEDSSSEELESHLSTLTHEELLRELARDPEIEFMFKHALTQEAAYNLLLMRRRKELHRRVGEVIEQLYPQRRDELAPTLAHHFWQGEDWLRAARFAMQAGARAARIFAPRDAIEHYERAYQALSRCQDPPPREVYDAIMAWVSLAMRFRSREQMLERLQEAEKIARNLDDKARLGQALIWIGNLHFLTGFRSLGLAALVEGQQLARELQDESLTVLPMFIMTTLMLDEDPHSALESIAGVIDLARRYHLTEVESHALATKAQAHAQLGESEQALENIDRALALAPTANSRVIEADVEMIAGVVYFDLGDLERAMMYGERGADRALMARGMECACEGFYLTGVLRLQANDVPGAMKALQESFAFSEFSEFQDLRNRVRATLAMTHALAGRTEAIQEVEQGLREARAMGQKSGAAMIAQGLGEVYLYLGDLERAKPHLEAALAHYREKSMHPYTARLLRSLALLYDGQGQHAEAERARAESQSLQVPLRQALASHHSSVA
jgi:class 3 adenylate cyclase/tetratricopeptide (TPR) repeat protein